MAVVAVWKCDRDGAMFDNKKEAEAHDKMLELAESITGLLNRNIDEIDETISREVGLLLAKRSGDLAKAIKGKPDALQSDPADTESAETDSAETESTEDSNVSPLASNQ